MGSVEGVTPALRPVPGDPLVSPRVPLSVTVLEGAIFRFSWSPPQRSGLVGSFAGAVGCTNFEGLGSALLNFLRKALGFGLGVAFSFFLVGSLLVLSLGHPFPCRPPSFFNLPTNLFNRPTGLFNLLGIAIKVVISLPGIDVNRAGDEGGMGCQGAGGGGGGGGAGGL